MHILVEKPFTTTVADADRSVEAIRAAGVTAMCLFNHRWVPAYAQAKDQMRLVGEPVVGYARKDDTIYVPTEMIGWADRTTCAWFLSSHDIDLLTWLYDDEVAEVFATARYGKLRGRGIDTPDAMQIQARFGRGAVATFESAWIYPNTFPTMVDSYVTVTGEKGVIQLDRQKENIQLATEDRLHLSPEHAAAGRARQTGRGLPRRHPPLRGLRAHRRAAAGHRGELPARDRRTGGRARVGPHGTAGEAPMTYAEKPPHAQEPPHVEKSSYVEKPPHVDPARMLHITDEALLAELGAAGVAAARPWRRRAPVWPDPLPGDVAEADRLLGIEVDFLDKGHGRSQTVRLPLPEMDDAAGLGLRRRPAIRATPASGTGSSTSGTTAGTGSRATGRGSTWSGTPSGSPPARCTSAGRWPSSPPSPRSATRAGCG